MAGRTWGRVYRPRYRFGQSHGGELATWIARSGLPVRRFFNSSDMKYRELGLKARLDAGMTDQECYELLATDGMLVKRPLLVGDDFAIPGFKEAAWTEVLL